MAVKTIAEYIEGLNENGQKYVSEFIQFMGQEYPHLNHKICFSMPMWLVGTKMNEGYVGVSGAKNHFTVHFSSEDFVLQLAAKLPACKTGKQCINIKYGDEESFKVIKESTKEFFGRMK